MVKNKRYVKVELSAEEFETWHNFVKNIDPEINTKTQLIKVAVREYINKEKGLTETIGTQIDVGQIEKVIEKVMNRGLKISFDTMTQKLLQDRKKDVFTPKRNYVKYKDILFTLIGEKAFSRADIIKNEPQIDNKMLTDLLGLYPDKFIINKNDKIQLKGDISVKK